MHSRRFACLLLGLWLGGGIFMAWVGSQNFRIVGRLMDQPNPSALLQFKTLGIPAARLLLRYQAAEQIRFYYESWETAQIILGTFFFFFLLFGTREDKYSLLIPLLMMIVTLAQRFLATPEMNSLGRMTDFIPDNVHYLPRVKLLVAQTGYSAAELVKGGLGLILALRLVLARRRRPSSSDVRSELDLVNKANYGHINR